MAMKLFVFWGFFWFFSWRHKRQDNVGKIIFNKIERKKQTNNLVPWTLVSRDDLLVLTRSRPIRDCFPDHVTRERSESANKTAIYISVQITYARYGTLERCLGYFRTMESMGSKIENKNCQLMYIIRLSAPYINSGVRVLNWRMQDLLH